MSEARFHIDRRQTPTLSAGSPFATLAEAAEFLRYKPCALSVVDAETLRIVRVRRRETAWHDRVVTVRDADWPFPARDQATLELCYEVEPIDYLWERGQAVRVAPCA